MTPRKDYWLRFYDDDLGAFKYSYMPYMALKKSSLLNYPV